MSLNVKEPRGLLRDCEIFGKLKLYWQASVGDVMAGSVFASLQSAGAAGLAGTTTAGIGAAAGAVGGGVAAGANYLLGRKTEED